MALSKYICDEIRKRITLDHNLQSWPIVYNDGTYNIYIEKPRIVIYAPRENNSCGHRIWERDGWEVIKESNPEKIFQKLNNLLKK